MIRSVTRFCLFLLSAALLTGLFLPAASADGPALTARFGIAGKYRSGGWCLVTVGVQNTGADTLSGQIQVLAKSDPGRSQYGGPARTTAPAVVFACPVSVPSGSVTPRAFSLYLRGIDPSQADLTVQLVEGRERGDGRVLASINNQNPNLASAFTGGPIASSDHLLVGFGGDPSAFTFLNGRAWTPSLPSLRGLIPASPETIQVAAVSASDLPDRAAGYEGVESFLLRSDAPVEGLTEAQAQALKDWVIGGGHLIVCGGPDSTRFGSAFFEGLLPATISSAGTGLLVLVPKPLPGVRVIPFGAAQIPQIISGPYGAGCVTLTAFDPTAAEFQAAGLSALPPMWQKLLALRPDPASSLLGVTAVREENYNAVYYGSSPPLLSEAVMRGPSLDAPGTSVIAVFLLVYLIVLVPVNYLVLKRFDRKELAWVTIPALVFVFAAGTFGVGYAAKGGSVFVNRAAVIETSAGQREAGVYSEVGLFSPHRTSYDITLPGANLAAAIPSPGVNYGSGNSTDAQASGTTQFLETSAGVSLLDTSVNMWAMRAFDTQSTTELGGAIEGSLTAANGIVTGNLLNHTSTALTDCAIFYRGRWLKVGTFAPGASVTIPSDWTNAVPQAAFPATVPFSQTGAQGSIHDRMQAALGNYWHSLGQQSGPNYTGGAVRLLYAPAPHEALLAGWSDDPKLAGPPPRIDGKSVTENDVSLVVVHVPLAAK